MKENHAILREPEGGYYARPFFSIVMAAYNQGKFIDETVKSVVGQSYERWELIIVNDGSKDDSWQRANALKEKYPKRRGEGGKAPIHPYTRTRMQQTLKHNKHLSLHSAVSSLSSPPL